MNLTSATHRKYHTLLLCLTAAALTFWHPAQSRAFDDGIIAVVNDELITLKDLKDYARSTYVSLIAEGAQEDQIRNIMMELETKGLEKLIEDKLILSQANKKELTVREDAVDERVKEVEQKYGSEQNLIDALIKSGATLTDLRNKIRDQLKIKFIVDHEVRSKIHINPKDVNAYYEKHKEDFSKGERVNLESIFIPYGEDKVGAFAKANSALKKIETGKPFEVIAKEYSSTPSIGIIEHGQFLPEIEKKVFHLDLNEISPLIEVETGIYIFKLTGKTPAKIPDLENLREIIHDRLYKDQFVIQFQKWLQALKEDAYIDIKI